MRRHAAFWHLLVLLSTLAGIMGTGLVYQAIEAGSASGVISGAALLLVGLWWSGGALGRSMEASRARRLHG